MVDQSGAVLLDDAGQVHLETDGSAKLWTDHVTLRQIDPSVGAFLTFDTGNSTNDVAIDDDGNVLVGGKRVSGKSLWKLDPSLNLLWAADTGAEVFAVATDPSGAVYAAGESTGENVWKFSAVGDLQWAYDTGVYNTFGIAVDGQGSIYVAGLGYKDGLFANLWKLTPGGQLIWSRLLGIGPNPRANSVGVAPNGTLFVGLTSWLYEPEPLWVIISADGEILGQRRNKEVLSGLTAIRFDSEGNVYAAGAVGPWQAPGLAAKFTSGGSRLWTFKGEGYYGHGLALGDDGAVYTSHDGRAFSIARLDPDGACLARRWLGANRSGIAYRDGHLYVAGDRSWGNKTVCKVDAALADGEFWSHDTGGDVNSLVLDGDKNLYVAGGVNGDGKVLHKFDPAGEPLWSYPDTATPAGAAIASGGILLAFARQPGLSKISSAGQLLWNSTSWLYRAYKVCCDPQGRIYTTGYWNGLSEYYARRLILLDSQGQTLLGHYYGGPHQYSAALAAQGDYVWASGSFGLVKHRRQANGTGVPYYFTVEWAVLAGDINRIILDGAGNAFVGGTRQGAASAWKVSPSGQILWSYDTGATVRCAVLDGSGGVYFGGDGNGNCGANLFRLDIETGHLLQGYLAAGEREDSFPNVCGIGIAASGALFVGTTRMHY